MAEILMGCLAGGCVCAFGLWAFLKGQRSMRQIQNGGLPDGLFGVKRARADTQENDLPRQLKSMFSQEKGTRVGE